MANSFVRDVLDEADGLGLTWWEHLALILAAALISVAARRGGRVLWDAIRSVDWKAEPAPEPISDGETAEDRETRSRNIRAQYDITDKLPLEKDDGNSHGAG